MTRGELLEQVWGLRPDTKTRVVDSFVVRLRRYIESRSGAAATHRLGPRPRLPFRGLKPRAEPGPSSGPVRASDAKSARSRFPWDAGVHPTCGADRRRATLLVCRTSCNTTCTRRSTSRCCSSRSPVGTTRAKRRALRSASSSEALRTVPLGTIDPEEFYDFTVCRPHVELEGGGTRRVVWPREHRVPLRIAVERDRTSSRASAASRTCAGAASATASRNAGRRRRCTARRDPRRLPRRRRLLASRRW